MDNMDLMSTLKDKEIDLAIVDPPYGIERFKKASGTTRFKDHKEMQKEGLLWDIKPSPEYFTELFRVSKHQIIWGANNFSLPPTEYFCIWNKMQTVENFASAEYAFVSMSLKKPALVFNYSIQKHNHTAKIHPTQKPVQLYKWLLDKYAKCSCCSGSGEIRSSTIDCDIQTCKKCNGKKMKILDTHLGSGSIAIACHDYGYDLLATEVREDYYISAKNRIKDHTNQQKLFSF